MARAMPEGDLKRIADLLDRHPGGLTAQEIAERLDPPLPHRTLQHHLKSLVGDERATRSGSGRSVRYRPASDGVVQVSAGGALAREHVRRPLPSRNPVGYDRGFLDAYRPNETFYLTQFERDDLRAAGTPSAIAQPAGTYARLILNRLLVDLSWNSSRLEGNTYSRLDTRRLLEFGQAARGKQRVEAQMILNHRDAIEFLVEAASEIGFNRYTILNLHALLANNLLDDPQAAGRLRHIQVAIEGSAFEPLAVPQLVEECFDQLLATAAAISDPVEQAFFVMVHLPYLQPFDDVNKRVSRLAANIPLIKANLVPLSFEDVPRELYTDAMLGVYELKTVDLLRDVFAWAYRRSAKRYAAVRQSLGEPDPFRLRHREALRAVVAEVVRGAMGKADAIAHVSDWARRHVNKADRERFRQVVEDELSGLHEGNFARYRIRPAEYEAWRTAWQATAFSP
jgi:DNA-binding transcriptional ArsR family regulator